MVVAVAPARMRDLIGRIEAVVIVRRSLHISLTCLRGMPIASGPHAARQRRSARTFRGVGVSESTETRNSPSDRLERWHEALSHQTDGSDAREARILPA
jgi:hypothetical protein